MKDKIDLGLIRSLEEISNHIEYDINKIMIITPHDTFLKEVKNIFNSQNKKNLSNTFNNSNSIKIAIGDVKVKSIWIPKIGHIELKRSLRL